MKEPTCTSCRFYRKPEGRVGECRFNPPHRREAGRHAEWPQVYSTDWCGRHRPYLKVVNTPLGVMMKPVEEDE